MAHHAAQEPKSAAGRGLNGWDGGRLAVHRRRQNAKGLAVAEFEDWLLGVDPVFRDAVGTPLSLYLVSQTFTKEWRHAGLRRV